MPSTIKKTPSPNKENIVPEAPKKAANGQLGARQVSHAKRKLDFGNAPKEPEPKRFKLSFEAHITTFVYNS